MGGFLPEGFVELASLRDELGPSVLGPKLAFGSIKAYRSNPWGETFILPLEFWRGRDAEAAMRDGRYLRGLLAGAK